MNKTRAFFSQSALELAVLTLLALDACLRSTDWWGWHSDSCLLSLKRPFSLFEFVALFCSGSICPVANRNDLFLSILLLQIEAGSKFEHYKVPNYVTLVQVLSALLKIEMIKNPKVIFAICNRADRTWNRTFGFFLFANRNYQVPKGCDTSSGSICPVINRNDQEPKSYETLVQVLSAVTNRNYQEPKSYD